MGVRRPGDGSDGRDLGGDLGGFDLGHASFTSCATSKGFGVVVDARGGEGGDGGAEDGRGESNEGSDASLRSEER